LLLALLCGGVLGSTMGLFGTSAPSLTHLMGRNQFLHTLLCRL
jgi:hypothetical protein